MSDGFLLYPPASGGSGSLADGDYGDITVSGSGTAMTVDAAAITLAKMADLDSLSIIANDSNGGLSPPVAVQATSAGQVLRINDAGTDMGWDSVSNASLRASGALSVIGRSANSGGSPADISVTAATDFVLRESGSTLGFGTVDTGGLKNNAVTDAKLRQGAALTVIGRSANSTGNVADIAASANDTYFGRFGNVLTYRAITTGDVQNAMVGYTVDRAIHTENFGDRKISGTSAVSAAALTMGIGDPGLVGGTAPADLQHHVAGLTFVNSQITVGRFGFLVPPGISGSDISVKMNVLMVGAGGGGDQLDIDIIGTVFVDGDGAAAGGTTFSVPTIVDVSAVSAVSYYTFTLSSLGVSVNSGDFVQGVIQRDALAGNADDIYANSFLLTNLQFIAAVSVL